MSAEAAAICRTAADEIERRGLHKGMYMPTTSDVDPRTCPVCLLGALNAAVNGDPESVGWYDVTEIGSRIRRALEDRLTAIGVTPTKSNNRLEAIWNDSEARTADDVTALLRSVADDLEHVQ